MPTEFPVSAPLIGRAADLGLLARVLGVDPPDPGNAVVLLAGDAGVGKTRLLAELSRQASSAGWQVLVGHCLNFGDSALPYLPFSEIFGTLAARFPERARSVVAANPAVARLMPGRRLLADGSDGSRGPDGGSGEPRHIDRAELFESVRAALGELGADGPVLLVMEDLHWADPSTREMLGFLFARPAAGPVAICASYRSDDLHRRHPLRAVLGEWARLPGVLRILLAPLSNADITSLVAALHPQPLPAADLCGIVERAEGNAFFAEELVAAADVGNGTVPAELADLLLVRLDQLPDAARLVVRAAAVAGRQVSHQLLARVVEVDDPTLEQAVRAVVEGNVLVPADADGYAFRHALLAEAVYDDLLPGERVRLHRAYVAALAAGDIAGTAAELARHARAAHDLPTAVRASISAGDEAMRVAGPVEAVRHYEVALELLPSARDALAGDGIDEIGLTVRASAAAVAAGDVFRGVALVADHLAELPPDSPPLQRARLLHALAGVALLGDTGVDVLEVTAEVLRLVPAEPASPLRAQAASLHARANADRYRDDDARRWAGEALALAGEIGLPEVTADAATTLGRLEERAGEPDSSRRTLAAAVVSAREGGDLAAELRSLFNIGSLHYELGQLSEARTAYQVTAARAREAGRPWAPYGFDARAMSGVLAYVSGRWDEATDIVAVAAESPPELAAAVLASIGLMVSAGRGERSALAEFDRLRPQWERDGMLAIISGGAAIDLYGDAGDLATAMTVHDELLACLSRIWQSSRYQGRIRLCALLLGQLCAQAPRAGTPERAELARRGVELLEVAHEVAASGLQTRRRRGSESAAWLARAAAEHSRLRWLTGINPPGDEELLEMWRISVAGFERFGHLFEIARSRARLAAVLRAIGQPGEAAEQAKLARTVATQLGAEPLLTELRPLAPPRRVPPSRGGQPLTAREREVLELVAQGRSNRDIGRQLYISGKTVSVHVSAILAKLGAAGRTEAVALASRQGLFGADRRADP
ncbi:MAG: AAA family ATPase [Frankiaceae bacterium]